VKFYKEILRYLLYVRALYVNNIKVSEREVTYLIKLKLK